MTEAIHVSHCHFSYGRRPVLDDIDFSVSAGEAVALAGPNGAGKTTLLNLMAGLLQPTAGTVEIHGRPVAAIGARELARQLAVVPQDTSFPFPYRVGEVVRMGRTPYLGFWGFDAQEDRRAAEEALALCDAQSLADRYVTQLSGGERQRVIVARALAQEPRILILDEPMRSLDPRHVSALLGVLARSREEKGLTVLMVSHDLNAAARLADRMVLMKAGRILEAGPPAKVLTETTLRAAYDVDVDILHTHDGRPVVVPTP